MSVILFNDFIHEWGKSVVRVVRTGINTNTGVSPLGTGENGLSESESEFISSILALFPDILSKAFAEEGLCAGWEVGEVLDVLGRSEVRSHHGAIGISDRRSVLSSHCF